MDVVADSTFVDALKKVLPEKATISVNRTNDALGLPSQVLVSLKWGVIVPVSGRVLDDARMSDVLAQQVGEIVNRSLRASLEAVLKAMPDG